MTRKLRVALVRGPIVFREGGVNNEATPAIAFAYISSYLRKHGYETVIVDAIQEGLNQQWPLKFRDNYNCQGLKFEEIIAKIPKESEVIAFSGMFSGEWPVLRELILEVRKHFPHCLFVVGGEHTTALTEYSLRDCEAIDVCVRGEGERTLLELLEAYRNNEDYSSIEGLAFLDDKGQYQQNGVRTPRIKDIDTIPWPDWPEGYLEKFWAVRKSYGINTGRDMPFVMSRGCPYKCSFCSNDQMYTNRYILRDLDDVIAEIKHWIERYDITSLQIYDLTAIVKKDWIVKFCHRLIDENINLKWSLPSGTRSEALDEETLALLKKTGCDYLVYAPESGSEESLIKIRKKIKLENLTQSALIARKHNITVRTNLIIGFPSETWKNVFETIRYGLSLAIKGIDEVPINIFSPYPGTEIFEGLIKENRLQINDDYFFSLTSLNSSYFSAEVPVSYSPTLAPWRLFILRAIFILTNYGLSYLCYPGRIFRTFRNLFTEKANTVFEHRLKDMFKRKTAKKETIDLTPKKFSPATGP